MTGRRKRILWLSHFVIYPPHGGSRIRSFNLLREIGREFDIDLFMLDSRDESFPGRDLEQEELELGKHARSVIRWPLRKGSTLAGKGGLFLRSLFSNEPVTTSMLYDPGYARRLEELAVSGGYDLVHLDTVDLAAYLPCFEGRIPRVTLNHHNVESRLMARQADQKRVPLLGAYYKLQAAKLDALERRMCLAVDANIVVSELDEAALSDACQGGEFRVILNGVDLDFHRAHPDRAEREAKTLVWAGGMHWFPNHDAVDHFVRDIWPQIHARREDLELLLVGSSPPESIQSAPGANRIDAPGYVPDVRPYLDRGDIYIAPIRVGSGTRLKILDAFASAIPVVSTAVGCEGLGVTDGEHLLVRDGAEAFCDGVLELAGNAELRNRVARNGRALVEQVYSWRHIGERARSLYRSLIAEETLASGDSSAA